jgi:hypothetical protein
MRIEKEIFGALFSGDGIHLAAHTGMRIDVDGQAVQARFSEAGEWQKLVIENFGGRAIFSGDTVFLKAHAGVFVDVEGVAVQARWNDRGGWQRLVIEKKHGSGAVMPGDTIFLRSHTGNFIDVQGERVQARWSERGDWQALVIQKPPSDASFRLQMRWFLERLLFCCDGLFACVSFNLFHVILGIAVRPMTCTRF